MIAALKEDKTNVMIIKWRLEEIIRYDEDYCAIKQEIIID